MNDWLGAEPEIPEDKIVETIDTEVLVCGAGTSGLFAACSAAEEGAKVVCIEKAAIGGGVRDNLGSLNSRLQKEAGCEIDENEICNDLMRYADGYCNPRLYHIWAQNSGEAIEGLYVTGVDSGSYYAHTYPNMSTGNCCGRSVTFARMIGKALAAK